MHITVQTCYDLQYLTIKLSGYINSPEEHTFINIKHGIEYLIHHPHEPIMYPGKKIHKTEERHHQCYFKAEDTVGKQLFTTFGKSDLIHDKWRTTYARQIT